jgi:hypothetical protein
MDAQIEKKTVNALVPDAEIGFIAEFVMEMTDTKITKDVLKQFQKAMGGLWVGGSATLYGTKLQFRPNTINRMVHADDYSLEIPLSEITEVGVRFGMVTRIIDIVTAHGKFSMRCYGAKNFAETIRNQVKAQKNKA